MSFLRKLFGRRAEPANAPAAAVQAPPDPAATWTPRPELPSQPAPIPPREDCLDFPLKAITDLFPAELKALLRKQPSEHVQVHIPRALIQPQLAAGAVRVTFAQLRAVTPEIFFLPDGAPDDAKVLLPLDCVLRQMTTDRRQGQRQHAIPAGIPAALFRPEQPRPNGGPARGSADPWYSQRRPTIETQHGPEPEPQPHPSAHAPAKKHFQPLASMTERPRREQPPAETPSLPPTPRTPPGAFALPLSAVLAALPEDIRHALNSSDAKTAAFLIPLSEIETRMRTGKLLFKWGQLRDWCSVNLSALATPELDIHLPLAAVVPLFMAARETQDPRRQIELDSRIPDIFAKASASAPAAPAPPVKAEPPPPAPLQPATVPAAPAQVLEHIRSLEGVTGSFIATADGLLVAADVPDANENVLAAFAPTVFAQLTKYADMAKLGLPESIDINLAGATVHVRKAGKLYLGVLLPGGRPVPHQELTRISKALQPHTT